MTTSGKVFVSIQLNSNRPAQIKKFIESVERTASMPEEVEILVHVDTGDSEMYKVLENEIACRQIRVRYFHTDIVKNFFDLWKPLNLLLKKTDPGAYFIANMSDEFLFLTDGWDEILRSYEHYYSDDIFRIRASKYRYRNYLDCWECGFAPDSLAFYTKKWFDIVGDWNPCFGPDSFQQCVSYYLYTADQFNINH